MKYYNLFILFLVYIQSSNAAKFGETCSHDNGCSDGSQCSGSGGRCGCPDGQEFFAQLRQCGLRAGATCDVNMDYYCVQGSKCDKVSKICKCDAPSRTLSNGACSPLLHQTCSASIPCTSGQFLECVGGRCVCSSPLNMVAEFFPGNQTSVCRAMTPGGKCANSGTQWPRCTENSECINGACQCIEGYGPTIYSACKKMYMESCDLNEFGQSDECNTRSGLVCKYGSCQCLDRSLFWDQEKGTCVAQLGSPCLGGSGHVVCADPNATCQFPDINMNQRPVCKCNSGYVEYFFRCIPDPAQPNCQCGQNNFPFFARP